MNHDIERILSQDGYYLSTTKGCSMLPLLKENRDVVQIKKRTERAKKFDVVLYISQGRYVLHRIIKVLPDSYIIRGDNLIHKEKGIQDKDILGVMVGLSRKGKEYPLHSFRYSFYVHIRRRIHYVWIVFFTFIKNIIKKIIRKK